MATTCVATVFKMRLASSAEYSIFWNWNDDNDYPCTCCSALNAIQDNRWICETTEREWFIVDDVMLAAAPQMFKLWADMMDEDDAERLARETPALKAAREAKAKAEEKDRETTLMASRMFSHAEEQKYRNTIGKGQQRHIRKTTGPCKWLFCDEKAPRSHWRKNEKGEWCAPVVKGLTGSQCWAHEYIDPKSKQWKKPHTCAHIHPNEDGWLPQWNTDRTYRPDRVAEGLAAMHGVVAPKLVATAVAPKSKVVVAKNAWAALEDSDDEKSGW